MVLVELHDIRLYAHHGIYEGEEHVGNHYSIDLVVTYDEGKTNFDSLSSTINYEELYQILQQRMHLNTPLLEKLAESIIGKIWHQYPFISEIRLSIYKLDATIENLQGRVGVTMIKKYND